jgi:hypothetical protein
MIMNTKALPLTIWLGSAWLALCFAKVQDAHARFEDPLACFRDTQCPFDQVCRSGVCAVPTEFDRCFPPPNAPCEYSDQACEGEICRSSLVTCSNPAGRCTSEERGGDCQCWDGHGSGWQLSQEEQDGSSAESTTTSSASNDEQLAQRCQSELVKGCGTEIPELPTTCIDMTRALCERVADLAQNYLDVCQRPIDRQQALWHCCNDLNQGGLTVAGATCMAEVKAETCESLITQLDACAQLGQSDNENDTSTDTATSSESGSASTSSSATTSDSSASGTGPSSSVEMNSNPNAAGESGRCSAVASTPWLWALAGVVAMIRRRCPVRRGSSR